VAQQKLPPHAATAGAAKRIDASCSDCNDGHHESISLIRMSRRPDGRSFRIHTNGNTVTHICSLGAHPPLCSLLSALCSPTASICNLPHEEGVGCIKCTGLTKAELNGQLTSPIARAEQDAENIGPKIARGNDTCGACENGVAQHEVAHTRENNEAARDLGAATLPDKEHQVVPEPGKDKPFYGTEWAGRTGELTRWLTQTLLLEALELRGWL